MGASLATFFTSQLGTAITAAAASSAVGYGLSRLTAPKAPNIAIPPPPGAALIDPSGQQAAADARRRAAAAGGLASTQAGAGAVGPTGSGKTLLGS